MQSLLDLELAAQIDRERRVMRLGPSLTGVWTQLVHRGHED